MNILVVEDEKKIAAAVANALAADHYNVTVARTGEEGFFLVNEQTFDAVVLDLMLPGRSGLEVLRTLRMRGLQTPVLILTAKDSVEDRVEGLDSGADDYLVKPSPSSARDRSWNSPQGSSSCSPTFSGIRGRWSRGR